jgi:hypothetical protein
MRALFFGSKTQKKVLFATKTKVPRSLFYMVKIDISYLATLLFEENSRIYSVSWCFSGEPLFWL